MTGYFLYADFNSIENLSSIALDINQLLFGLLGVAMIILGNITIENIGKIKAHIDIFQFVELNNGYIVTWFFTKSGGFFFLWEVITM